MNVLFQAIVFACFIPITLYAGTNTSESAIEQVDTKQSYVDEVIRQADSLHAAGDDEKAEKLLRNAVASDPSSVPLNNALGEFLLHKKNYPDAMTHFEAALVAAPSDSRAQEGERQAAIDMALAARNEGHGENALAILNRARTFLPDDVTVLTDLGIQAQSIQQLPLAAEALQKALRLQSNDATVLYALARVETDQEHFAAAEEHFRAYLALRPTDASAHYGLGHLMQMQLKTTEAKSEFERSIALQPVQTESYYQLGQIALDAGDSETASAMFTKVLNRMPAHGGALSGIGILAYRSGHYDEARSALSRACQASPKYQPAHYYLGLTLNRLGEKDAASQELKIAADLAAEQQGKGKPTIVLQSTPP